MGNRALLALPTEIEQADISEVNATGQIKQAEEQGHGYEPIQYTEGTLLKLSAHHTPPSQGLDQT